MSDFDRFAGINPGFGQPSAYPDAATAVFELRKSPQQASSLQAAAELLPGGERQALAAELAQNWDSGGAAQVHDKIRNLHAQAARQAGELQEKLPGLWDSLEQLQNQSQKVDTRMENISELNNPGDALHLMFDVMRVQRTTELISKLVGETIGTVQKLTVKAEG